MRSIILRTTSAAFLAIGSTAFALPTAPVITTIAPPNANYFSGGPVTVQIATVNNNRLLKFGINPASTGGGGFTIPISNGENGRDTTAGRGPMNAAEEYRTAYQTNYGFADGINHDLNNPTPVGLAIAAVNNGGRIQNGNAFRFSVWVKHDVTKPVTSELAVEPVMKFELWSDAQSTYADYDGTKLAPDYGDRLWDTDINGRNDYFQAFDNSESTEIDINNDGDVVSGETPVVSIPPGVVGNDPWTLVTTTFVVDDHPDDSTFGWQIGGVDYYVDSIEEIRATFFAGDFGATSSTQTSGNFFVDNALVEVFANEADMLATPNPNTAPVGYAGDLNFDEHVDGADVLLWQRGYPLPYTKTHLNDIEANFGSGGVTAAINAAVLAYAGAVPEPAAATLLALGAVGMGVLRKRR